MSFLLIFASTFLRLSQFMECHFFGQICPLAAPEVSEIQLAETQNDSGKANCFTSCRRLLHVRHPWLWGYIPVIPVFQRSLAWQWRQRISIRMSLPSAGSARGASWALWPPRPHPPLDPTLKASSQPTASVNCPGVNWKREVLKCGSVCTTSPWGSRSPVRPEVRKTGNIKRYIYDIY